MPKKINDGLTNRQRYHSRHPGVVRKSSSDWKRKNPDKVREYRKRHQHLMGKYLRNRYRERMELIKILKAQPCADCGREYPHYVMEFDHKIPQRGKRFMWNNVGLDSFFSELELCDVVCANCHCIREWGRRQKHHSN